MKSKTLLTALILLMSTSLRTVYGQESDTICLPIQTVKVLASSHEKLIFTDSLNRINEEEIYLLTELLEEKYDQLQMSELLIRSQRTQIGKLQNRNRLLSIGFGAGLIGVIVLLTL